MKTVPRYFWGLRDLKFTKKVFHLYSSFESCAIHKLVSE